MQELVSIVIPTFNRAECIKECIENIKLQTYANIEIIIVDDGSKDNTEKIINEMEDDSILYYKFIENQGACAARNMGVNLAKGKYIAFQDSDDLWDKTKITKQVEYLEKNDLDIVFCSMNVMENDKIKFVIPDRKIPEKELYKKLLLKNFVSTQTILGKRQCFIEEEFDRDMPRLQDYDLMLRLVPKFKVGHLNEALVYQKFSENSLSHNAEKLEKALDRLAIKYKNISGLANHLYVECGYRNYFLNYGLNSKGLFKKALKNKFTIKAFLLYLVPNLILNKYINRRQGKGIKE